VPTARERVRELPCSSRRSVSQWNGCTRARGNGSPYLTGVPPIRPLRPACPDPAGRTYGALAAAPLLATVRDPLRRGSLRACRAAQPENRGPVCRCRHSRAGFPHPPLARREQARRPVSAGFPIPARSGPGNYARPVHISTNPPVNYCGWQTKRGASCYASLVSWAHLPTRRE
jgi:hypothetical protein